MSDVLEWAVPRTPSCSLLTLILLFTLSTLRTVILSVLIPIISFGAIASGVKLPVTDRLVTIPVAAVVPIPVFKSKKDVLKPIRCLPSNCLKESVERPETVIISLTTKPCGCDDNPITFPFELLYVNTTSSILTTVEATDTISFPSTKDISPAKPFPLSKFLTLNFSFTWYPDPELSISYLLILPGDA